MPASQLWSSRPGRRVAVSAFVFLKGDPARSVYWLRAGLVKTSVVWRDGRELILRLVRPGELFGEASLTAGEHEEHARALEESEIVEIPEAEFVTQVTREPGAAAATLREEVGKWLEVRCQTHDCADVEVSVGPPIETLADAGGERVVDGRMAQCALDAH